MRHFLPEVQFENPLSDFAELADFRRFHRKCFDDAIARHRLVENVGHLRHLFLVGFAQQPQIFSKPYRRIKDQRSKNERNRGKLPIDREDRNEQENQNRRLLEEFGECFRRRRLNPVDVV